MAIVRSGGKIVSKDGALGTGQACCCGGGGSCCAFITETKCCYALPEEEGVPSEILGYYITDAERIALEEQCAALDGVLRITNQRYKCLTITTGTPDWTVAGTATAEQCAVSQPCSNTCPPPPVPDCPVAPPPLDGFLTVSPALTFEEALEAVNDINGGNTEGYAETCPPPLTVRAFGPYQVASDCTPGGLAYEYHVRCLVCTEACGVPIYTSEIVVDGETVFVTQVLVDGEWITVADPSVDATDPNDIGYYCEPFYCDALSGFCVAAELLGISNFFFNYGPGYGRVCATCPAEPEYTLCCNNLDGCDGPTPGYGIPFNFPELVVPPGATCEEWCNCGGPFLEWRYDVDNDPTYAQDCSQCIDWCNPEDCSFVVTGRDLNGNLVECDGCNPLP